MINNDIYINYGSRDVFLNFPDSIRLNVLTQKNSGIPLKNFKNTLEKIVDSSVLLESESKYSKVAIILSDRTRQTPNKDILDILIKKLFKMGIKKDKINIIFGLGTHPTMSPNDMYTSIGHYAKEFSCSNHDSDGENIFIGKTSRGTNIEINKIVYDADFIIADGRIFPHPWAGFSGGSKSVLPGVSSRETIFQNHSRLIFDPNVDIGNIYSNPVREDMNEAARIAGLNLIINVILNNKSEVIHAVCGDPITAFNSGAKFALDYYGVEVDDEYDVVIANTYPFNNNFYHGCNSLVSARNCIKEGGEIILLAPCLEGVGGGMLSKYCSMSDEKLNEVLTSMPKDFASVLLALTNVGLTRKKAHINMVTDGIPQKVVESWGFSYLSSIKEAVKKTIRRGDSVAVLTNGSVIPISSKSRNC